MALSREKINKQLIGNWLINGPLIVPVATDFIDQRKGLRL